MSIPHPDDYSLSVNCAIVTVSDTRTKNDDESGELIQKFLLEESHNIAYYEIVKDEPQEIESLLNKLANNELIQAIVFTGGTGISARDTTYDVLSLMLEKTLFGFGEIFRSLSYRQIGSRAIASRATAGVYKHKIIFSLPGSKAAVSLAMEQLILPELTHLVTQINPNN